MKPSIPRGTRDFGPAEMRKRTYILDTLRRNFGLYGFQQLETPAMENLETLTGKYGDEGDQLVYKILNSRLHEHRDKEGLKREFDLSLEGARNSGLLTEKALRYDLTVPFARYVVMNQHTITFPFRRFQIQPVWRADKPQKGRYREFWQCDADIAGSVSLINELDLISLIDRCFRELELPVQLNINNRKILSSIAEKIGAADKVTDITVAIDKLEKIGLENVQKELSEKGLSSDAIRQLEPLFAHKGNAEETLKFLSEYLPGEPAATGISELRFIFDNLNTLGLSASTGITIDLTLARGLNYYTGTIFEARALRGSLSSSILGGGRYDDLTGIFGLKNVSGVGISFGIDRIYDVMEEAGLFPGDTSIAGPRTILFSHFDETTRLHAMFLATTLRDAGITAEVYPDITKKISKQFEYANKRSIPFVCVVGENEMSAQKYNLKNMTTGEQQQAGVEEIISILKAQK